MRSKRWSALPAQNYQVERSLTIGIGKLHSLHFQTRDFVVHLLVHSRRIVNYQQNVFRLDVRVDDMTFCVQIVQALQHLPRMKDASQR